MQYGHWMASRSSSLLSINIECIFNGLSKCGYFIGKEANKHRYQIKVHEAIIRHKNPTFIELFWRYTSDFYFLKEISCTTGFIIWVIFCRGQVNLFLISMQKYYHSRKITIFSCQITALTMALLRRNKKWCTKISLYLNHLADRQALLIEQGSIYLLIPSIVNHDQYNRDQ